MDTVPPNTADVGVQAEMMTRSDIFGLPPLINLNTCIQATRNPGEDPTYLLVRIAAAYRMNVDRPLSLLERGNLWSMLTLVAGVRRAQAQEILSMARVLEAHRMRGLPNRRLARNIQRTIQAAAGWELDDQMFQETRSLLTEKNEANALPSDSGDGSEGPESPDENF